MRAPSWQIVGPAFRFWTAPIIPCFENFMEIDMEWRNPDGSLTGGVVIEDGAGNKLGTAANPLNVTGGVGGGGGSNASVGSTGSFVPANATAIGFQNASGNLAVPSLSAGLPIADSGAAAAGVSQPAGGSGLSGWLSGIYAKLTSTLSVSWSGQSVSVSNFPATQTVAGSVSVSNLPATQAISAAALPVPTGAAADGTDSSMATMPTGGVGIRGWLSGIYAKVAGTLTVSWTGQSVGVSNFPSTQTVAGAVSVSNLPATQAISAAALPLPSGAAADGTDSNIATMPTGGVGIRGWLSGIYAKVAGTLTVSWTGQSVGVSSLPALAAGTAVIGYAGSLNFQTSPVVPTIQAAAYSAGYVIGGKQTLTNFFRNTTQPSATLSQFLLGWGGTEAVSVAVYLFSRNPTNSTITDKAAFVLAAADAQYLVTAPFTLTASASPGSTQTFAAQSLSLSTQNLDASVSRNLYAVLVVGSAVTPAVGDLFFSISGVQD
jgi:Flp pilus assembly pilin Flp